MNMEEQIVRIRKEDAGLFEALDPYGRLAMLDVPNTFALAALAKDEEGYSVPAGLMTGLVSEDSIGISWLGVDASRQGQGIGEKLLLTAYKIADSGNLARLEAIISSEYERYNSSNSGKNYFTDRLFEVEKTMPVEFSGMIGELKQFDYMKQNLKRLPHPIPLSSLTPIQIREALGQLDNIADASKLYSVSTAKERVNADISYLFMDEGEAYSALLIQKLDDSLLPVYFYGESENESSALILSSVAAAEKKFGDDMDVQIFLCTDKLRSLMNSIFPGKKSAGKKLVANVDDYRVIKNRSDREDHKG